MRVFIATGEASGDRLATLLLGELERRRHNIAAWGVVGPGLRERGVVEVGAAEAVSAVGLVEAVARIPAVLRTLSAVDEAIGRYRPDVVLTVDAPSFALRVARRAKERGIPTVHWVSPQVWAWRPWRVKSVARSADAVLCLFPFEPALYEGLPIQATFVGHPAVERALRVERRPRDGVVVGLAPGSREAEVRRLWPVMCDVARRIASRQQGVRFVVPVARTVDRSWMPGLECDFLPDLGIAAARADVFVTASGTATIELAAAGVPQVVIYQVHPITYAVGRLLVRGVEHLSLPNILAGAGVVPEHVQHLDAERITADVLQLLGPEGDAQVTRLRPFIAPLGERAIARTADALLEALKRSA